MSNIIILIDDFRFPSLGDENIQEIKTKYRAYNKDCHVVLIVAESNAHRSTNFPLNLEWRTARLNEIFSDILDDNNLLIADKHKRSYIDNINKSYTQKTLSSVLEYLSATSGDDNIDILDCTISHEHSKKNDKNKLRDYLINGNHEVSSVLESFKDTEDYLLLKKEMESEIFIKNNFPTENVHTADVVAVRDGHLLVIERKGHPYQGCVALPGGIVDKGENYLVAAIRELKEETNVSKINPLWTGGADQINNQYVLLTDEELLSFLVNKESEDFSDRDRDPRGTYHAHAFVFDFSSAEYDIVFFAGDDAAKAYWIDIKLLKEDNMAFDHYAMLEKMNIVPMKEIIIWEPVFQPQLSYNSF